MSTDAALKQQAYQFITSNQTAALSTVDEKGNPHVAPVSCVVRKDLAIYFSTRTESRKFNNLMKHPTVAMAFINEVGMAVIQLSGVAERIESLEFEQSVLYDLAKQQPQDLNGSMPTLKMFEQGLTSELAIVKVIPTEMTYANFAAPKTGKYKEFFQKII
jgi:uncharacterized pyridoxamine 5'-phosphate oxidase family protein